LITAWTFWAAGANVSNIAFKPGLASLSLVTLLTGRALVTIFAISASLALRARIAALSRIAAFTLLSDLSPRTYLASLASLASLTDLTLQPILELGQTGTDPLVEGGHGNSDLLVQRSQASHRASDDGFGLSLHQLDVALPLNLLVVQRLRERDPPRINEDTGAVVRLAQ
jgi:hypothetical protein